MVPERFRVTDKRREIADTWTLELEPLDREDDFTFLPGQFNMLYAFGVGEVPISVSGDPGRAQRLVHTVREVGAASGAICRAAPGDVLGVRGPFGSCWPTAKAVGRDVLIVAGGIGLAPLRPVVYEVLSERDRYGRASLLYGGREPDQLLYEAEHDAWRERGLDVEVTVDIAPAGWSRQGGRGADPGRTRSVRCRYGRRVRVRPGGDDPLLGRGAHRRGVSPRTGCTSRWSAT